MADKLPLHERLIDGNESYERIENETEDQWRKFVMYRDYFERHPTETRRNIKKCVMDFMGIDDDTPPEDIDEKKIKTDHHTWRQVASKNDWRERAEHFDTQLDRDVREQRNKALTGVSNTVLNKINQAIKGLDTDGMKASDVKHMTDVYGSLMRFAGELKPDQLEILTKEDEREIAAAASNLTEKVFRINTRNRQNEPDAETA